MGGLLDFMRGLAALILMAITVSLPFLIPIAVFLLIMKAIAKRTPARPMTEEERRAEDLRQIRYNLEDLNAKRDVEIMRDIWKKK